MSSDETGRLLEQAQDVVRRAMAAGADVAEAMAKTSRDLSVKVRLGAPELVEEAGSSAIGLRVLKGGRSATTSTSDLGPTGLAALVADAIELAELAEPDPLAGPPDASERQTNPPPLDLYDPALDGFDAKDARMMAIAAEDAARAADPRITNSEGATCGRSVGSVALVTSDGFAHGYRTSFVSLVVEPLADDEEQKKRVGVYWDARRYLSELADPAHVGREAARRTVAKLGAKKIPSAELPVVFSPEAARSLLGLLASCLNGASVYKRQSYLADREGEMVASPIVHVVDDPLLPRGPASRPFDGEGLPSRRNVLLSDGKLGGFLLDTYSARRLGKKSTGSAARGVGGRPSPSSTNLHLLPTNTSPEAIVGSVERGLYVTSTMGFGFNSTTGDFSRGAEGFLIEDGKITDPVGEITIGLGFVDLWARVDAVGSDLDFKSGIAAPTFRVAKMAVAGT